METPRSVAARPRLGISHPQGLLPIDEAARLPDQSHAPPVSHQKAGKTSLLQGQDGLSEESQGRFPDDRRQAPDKPARVPVAVLA